MTVALTLKLDEETLAALDKLALERGEPRDKVVAEALEVFLGLKAAWPDDELADWQLEQIRQGLEQAERGDFASEEEITRVRGKFVFRA